MNAASWRADQTNVMLSLSDRLSAHDDNRNAVQIKIHKFCNEMRAAIDNYEESLLNEFEVLFVAEDSRLQVALNCVRAGKLSDSQHHQDPEAATRMGKAELAVEQIYDFCPKESPEEGNQENHDMHLPLRGAYSELALWDYIETYKLDTRKKVVDEWLEFKKPSSLKIKRICAGRIYLSFVGNAYEDAVLCRYGFGNIFQNDVCFTNRDEEKEDVFTLRAEESEDGPLYSFVPGTLKPNTKYSIKVKTLYHGRESEWSDEVEFACGELAESCVWLECPENVAERMRYTVDGQDPRVVSKKEDNRYFCAPLGNVALPYNTLVPWKVGIVRSKEGDCNNIFVGIAPSDMNQNSDFSYNKCGWYFSCFDSTLVSGPPHKYLKKEYGPRMARDGMYVRNNDSVGVVMDTNIGELSFVVGGVDYGVAYEGIPLDKPLVLSVVLYHKSDAVKLDFTRINIKAYSGACVPRNIAAKSSTWDSITLEWDPIMGALFYQIEMDSSRVLDASTTNKFTMRGLRKESEHTFRVRAVKGDSVSEWSDIVKGRTEKASFKTSGWKECPENIEGKKYCVDKTNSRIVVKTGYNYCYSVIIGDVPLQAGKSASWKIKLLNITNPKCAFVGVIPADVDQNTDECFRRRGWHIRCSDLTLSSGPPHDYRDKRYLERTRKVARFDSIGVEMDMGKGTLSFFVNGENLGVAYERIPLDEPLVPSVMVGMVNDSAEIVGLSQ